MASSFRLRAVFLDAGGTLLHESPSRWEIYADAARAHGLSSSAAELREAMIRAHDELPRELGPHFRYSRGWFEAFIERVFAQRLGLARERLPQLQRELFARFEAPGTFRLFPGARELIRSARALGLKVGVVSNWSESLPGILAGLGLAEELDFTVVSALERCEKPERAIFELALARSGVNPREAAHVGDCPERDVRGAGALGMLTALVERSGVASAAPADRTCADLFEVERWIRELATT